MKRKKVYIIGHFGFDKNLLNGQTIKTKMITGVLTDHFGEYNVETVDTHGGISALIKAPGHALKSCMCAENIIIMPATNGLRVYAPLLSFFRSFCGSTKLYYIVIGGWLPGFLQSRDYLKKLLQRFDGIYVETQTMRRALEQQGFSNVLVMPNCKELTTIMPEDLPYKKEEPYPLCTFSRVMKEKGIEDAVEAVKAVNARFGRTVYELDIYGQIDPNQTEWFVQLQKEFPEYVQYKGAVPYDQSVNVLKNYFALLFPTYYDGEGFAGTLLDAMASGVPVIASDWKYNSEIVKDGQTGVLYPARDKDALVACLYYACRNVEKWNAMRYHCIEEAKKYRPEEVVKVIIDKIETRTVD